MGKRNYCKNKYGDARILYKKSKTICTQSRTCSLASQFYTRSSIFQYKKNVSQTNEYYIECGKIKRDLSIETDVCILRRYYKIKRNKLYTKDSSNKTKYSDVITDIDTDKEFKHGACGDSKTKTKGELQIDTAAIMVDNLKLLLTKWIQKHLLDHKDTHDKIETVLHSILQSGKKTYVKNVSSRSTYILSREGHKYEVKNKKVETASFICDYCKHKSRPITTNIKDLSCQSVPMTKKKRRVLSTLSIPRKINMPKINSLFKVKKIKLVNNYSIYNRRKLLDSSSFDLLAISTRSFTKRCANYGMKRSRKRRITFQSKQYGNVSNTAEAEEKEERRLYEAVKKAKLEEMPSLVKSIYADHPANFTRPHNINRSSTSDNDIVIVTKKKCSGCVLLNNIKNVRNNDKYWKASFNNTQKVRDQSEPMNTNDAFSDSMEILNEKKVEENTSRRNVNVNNRKSVYLTKKRRYLKILKPRNIQNKKFPLSHKKIGDQTNNNSELVKHIQSILEYVTKDRGNFKFNIHVSLLPVRGKCVDASSHISNVVVQNKIIDPSVTCNVKPPTNFVSVKEQTTKISSLDPSEKIPEIIALLDGAASQAKYIFTTDNSIKSEQIKVQREDHATKTSKFEIVQEIHDLKSVVKNLLHTAENLVSEQLKKENYKRIFNTGKSNIVELKSMENLKPPTKPISKGIQISNDFAKNLHLAGIKLSKEPKRDTTEFCHRLMRKSTSYKIIESESVLRVTDMTVGGKTENSPESNTCILPKSKSLINVTKEKNKVVAYFCDGGCNSDICCRQNNSKSFTNASVRSAKHKKKQKSLSSSSCECSKNHTHQPVLIDSQKIIPECPTSVYIDIEECCDKKSLIPTRKGMGFGEGFIYCLLLWIPVTIIAVLFYKYVIKDWISPIEHKATNKSVLSLKMSDLGF